MTIEALDALGHHDPPALGELLAACCGSRRWVDGMLERHPWGSEPRLLAAATEAAAELAPADWLEAFAHHPRIGDAEALRRRFGARAGGWSQGEQAAAENAAEEVIERLAEGNRRYEERFGYLFIVRASGRSAAEMLAILESRLDNDPDLELEIAAREQLAITCLRLEKLLAEG